MLDHIAHRDAGPVHDLRPRDARRAVRAPRRARPVRGRPAGVRALAPLPPLGVRVGGARPRAAPERRPAARGARTRPAAGHVRVLHPARWVRRGRPGSTTEPVRNRLAKYPTLRFKLDPENDWDGALISELKELAGVDVLDLKGLYRGTPVDVETDPELYRAVAEAWPDAYLEDPDLNEETEPVLAPHADRITWDAPLHSLADVVERAEGDQLEALAVRLPRGAVLDLRPLRARGESRSTAAGRASSGSAAARSSTSPRCSIPTPPTTSPPRATTTRRCPTGSRPARWIPSPPGPASAGGEAAG